MPREFTRLTRQGLDMVRKEDVCQRSMSAPRVGPITALAFRATIDRPERFSSSRAVGPHRSGAASGADAGALPVGRDRLHRMWAEASAFNFGKQPAAPAAWPKADQSGKRQERSFRLKGRCPDRSLGTMGEAISLSVPNLPNKGWQGRETD